MSQIAQCYGIGQALINVLPPPVFFETTPSGSNWSVGQIAFTGTAGAYTFYIYQGADVWETLVSASGAVTSVTGTTNEITASPTVGAVVLTIPSTFVAPGSIASTTTLTGGTGVTATTGNITASAVGSGLVLTPTVVAAGASPQTANGRVFSVTFSGVSIASGAAQTFVISNTAITGSGTVTSLTWSGATQGSGLSIESVTPSASQLSIVMTNATSATMVTSTANITFTGIVLN